VGAEDDLYAKWLKWLETVRNETHTLWLYRDYWRGLTEMTQANEDIPPSTFFDALRVWYAAAQMTGVRRQLDRDKRSVSLWRLLTDIADHPEVMTRERYVALYENDDERPGAQEALPQRANEDYNRFAGAGKDVLARTHAGRSGAVLGAYSSSRSKQRSANASRRSSQDPSRSSYGAYCTNIDIRWRPGGATVSSTAEGIVRSSTGSAEGRPYLASSNARSM
jgi:hypothetical protein